MAKATITTREGVKITVEGTPKEVADLVSQLQGDKSRPAPAKKGGRGSVKTMGVDKSRPTPISLITDLIDGGFFKKPRELSAIKNALAEQGYHYPVTSLSPTALRLVRKRHLRRIKDKKRWLYVQ